MDIVDSNPKREGVFSFSFTPLYMHVVHILRRPMVIVTTATAVFSALWTFREAMKVTSISMADNIYSLLWLLALSLVIGVLVRAYQYSQSIPEGLERCSRGAQSIAHWQRPRWEFRLAKVLLAEQIGPYDRELQDISSGRVFVLTRRIDDLEEYLDWCGSRIDNILKMIDVEKLLLVQDFPSSLESSAEKAAEPKRILNEVEKVARFYRETVEFERESHSIAAADELQMLQKHQLNWTQTARDGVHQFFFFLQMMCDLNAKESDRREFKIMIEEPPALEKFREELRRITARIEKHREG